MNLATKLGIVVILLITLFTSACSNNQNQSAKVDEKYYCENANDCVDGEYCQVTEPGGCVGAKWWWKNVGNKFDCEPDPSICKCVNNRCIKK